MRQERMDYRIVGKVLVGLIIKIGPKVTIEDIIAQSARHSCGHKLEPCMLPTFRHACDTRARMT